MADDEPTFPIQTCHSDCIEPQHHERRISERMATLGYNAYAERHGTSQSFERLHERGGFSWGELILFGVEGVKPHQPRRGRRV